MAARVATNVRLDPVQLRCLKQIALERGLSLSALFQELVSEYLDRTRALTGKKWQADPFFRIGRQPGRSGASTVAEDHDRHLYRPER
jgi:hypothetical protein